MATWIEIVPDLVLCALYICLLLRIVTTSDRHFTTPFFTFFKATGVYSIIAVLSYQLLLIFQFNEESWTVCFYKILYAGNSFGASGAMYGKVAIVIHRYFVMRRKDFSEKVLSMKAIRGVLIAQFVLSLLETAAIWPASYEYMNWNGREIIILKGQAVLEYSLYIFCNSIFTILTSREMHRMRRMLKDTTATSRSIILQQRNMFIIVTVCSLTHLIKVLLMLIATQFELDNLYYSISPLYPLANGLATYSTPICLVLLSLKLQSRLIFASGNVSVFVSPTAENTLAKT